MILLTRINGEKFALNPDLIERAEPTPDTVLTMVDGTKYVVAEPVEEVIKRVAEFRAMVASMTRQPIVAPPEADPTHPDHLRLVRDDEVSGPSGRTDGDGHDNNDNRPGAPE